MKKVILEVKNLKKYFYNSNNVVKAIDDVNFELHEGEIVGLIGESGSGKTTVGRTLIRLYRDFNGLVSLNQEILSAQKISKAKSKFLHRHMQMIFQDPHASLNAQQNVYTILKEPLVVNGILKIMIKEIFSDLKEVQYFYRYTFEEKLLISKINVYREHVYLLADFLKTWKPLLQAYQYDFQESAEDNFNRLFSFLDARQNLESQLVSALYNSVAELYQFYFQKQNDFRNNKNLDEFELALKKAQSNYQKAKLLLKKSYHAAEKEEALQQENELLKSVKRRQKRKQDATLEYLLSYKREFYNDSQLFKLEYQKRDNFEEYNHYQQQYFIYKKLLTLLKKHFKVLVHLRLKEAQTLIHDLKAYKNEIQKKLFTVSKTQLDTKKTQAFLEANFKFDFRPFLDLALANQNTKTHEITQLETSIITLKSEIKNSQEGAINREQFLKFEQALKQAQLANDQAIAAYKAKIQNRVLKAQALFEKIESKFLEAELRIDLLLNIFKEKFNDFLVALNQDQNFLKKMEITAAPQKQMSFFKKDQNKALKLKIDVFKNTVNQKYDSLKSFKIELAQLQKDTKRLEHLFGLRKNWQSYKKIKKLILNEKIYSVLDDVGLLRQFAWRYPHEFSGGQRQRIVIARALISEPKIIIADEPIASLDVSIQAQIVNLLKDLSLKKNIALLFIAHDLSMVEYIADYIHIMHLGKIVESGTTQEIFNNPYHPYTKNLFASIPKISNANLPFETPNFTLDYLKEQSFKNKAQNFMINSQHFLYATKSQKEKWLEIT